MNFAATTHPIVEVEGLVMQFDSRRVVDGLSFEVRAGEVFGLLGSNGSGKTTTIRALLGIYQPTAGRAQIGGRPYRAGQGVRVGYLPEERGLYKKETVIEVMTYFGRLKGLSGREARLRSLAFLERVGLGSQAKTRLSSLSGGQQQKVQLGVTIMHAPELLILDEPTKGFDPVNRRLLMEIIHESHQAGAAVVLVTHQMDEVERLCDRVLLLKDGTAAAYGTVAEVQERFGSRVARVTWSGAIPIALPSGLRPTGPRSGELALVDGVDEAEALRTLIDAGIAINGFDIARTSMEEVFLQVYAPTADKGVAA